MSSLDPKQVAKNRLTRNISVYPKLSSPVSQIKNHYEVIVIGSGYGASVAASRLARLGKVPSFLFSFIDADVIIASVFVGKRPRVDTGGVPKQSRKGGSHYSGNDARWINLWKEGWVLGLHHLAQCGYLEGTWPGRGIFGQLECLYSAG